MGWARRSILAGAALVLVAAQTTAPAMAATPAMAAEPTAASDNDWRMPAAQRAEVEALGRTLVEAMNAPDDASRRRLIEATYAPDAIAQVGVDPIAGQLARIGQEFPGLAFHSAALSEGRRGQEIWRVLHVYARRPGDTMYRDIQARITPAAPHRLTQIVFIAEVSEPIALPNGEITSPETLEWLNAYIDRLVKEYDLFGAALVTSGDRVLLERSFGFEDVARTKPITTSTHFSLASASKMFTALAVAKLVADGKLAYSTTIDRYFPDFPDPAFARRVTIGQLLSHTSGIGEYWTNETADAVRKARSTEDLLPLVHKAGTRFDPGTQFAYSNSNYALAGLIVEKVAGKSYEAYVAEIITTPLGLRDTGAFELSDPKRHVAETLTRAGGAVWVAAPHGIRGTAAGGWLSTPRDMERFLRGLHAGRILPPDALAPMLVSKTADLPESGTDYGYGFILERYGRVESYGHGGIAGGMNAEVRYFPSLDIALVLFSNQDNGAYDDLRKNIIRLITGAR